MTTINIVVTGAVGAGKTTFIKNAGADFEIRLDKILPAESLYREVEISRLDIDDDFYLYLSAMPLAPEYRRTWPRLKKDLAGVILLVGESHRQLAEVKEFVKESADWRLPVLAVVNQQKKAKKTAAAFRRKIGWPADRDLLVINARNKTEVRAALVKLLRTFRQRRQEPERRSA